MLRDRASILWTSLESGAANVVVGASGQSDTFSVPASVRAFTPAVTKLGYTFYQYQADITGLRAGTEYAYRPMFKGAAITAGPAIFRTAAPGNFSFLVFGDSGEDTPSQRTIVRLMDAEPDISFLVHTGDLVYPNGTFALYDSNYFGLNAPLLERLPVFPTPGNHDYLADWGEAYLASHSLPASGVEQADLGRYYSFDWGEAHFTCFDSNLLASPAEDRMLRWLENDLSSTRQFWKIVFLHHAPYPTGHHLGDAFCATVRIQINPIMERLGVHLVLGGHEHGYERTGALARDERTQPGFGTTYLITGGGGAGLHDVNYMGQTDIALQAYHYLRVDVDAGSLTVRPIGIDGREIERCGFRPRPILKDRGVVSIGDYSESLAPGSLVSIFGQNLAVTSETANGSMLPLQLGGVRVEFEGRDIPLLYVSPSQINAQLPYDAPARGTLEIFSGNGSALKEIAIRPTAPSILAVTTKDALATLSNAPTSGDEVVVYVTGLGACRQPAAAGSPVAAATQTIAQVDVLLGDLKIEASFAGLTPAVSGVYQVIFRLPPDLAAGAYPLRIATPDASSRSVALAVR